MDVSFVIRQRLEAFGLEQRELARAAQVTESYISQLLTRKKAPPAPNRTDIYDRLDSFLKLPSGELARLADVQRKEQLKRELGEECAPLFRESAT
jgi:transcriptional regulator with XRE-family HTH domain